MRIFVRIAKTYEMDRSGPAPMAWSAYETIIMEGWRNILESEEGYDEAAIQRFLEHHPSLVPGAFGVIGNSGHAPVVSALVAQPELPGFRSRRPDFMWISKNSVSIQPVLVEIEAPSKRWFRKDGVQTADLTQALDQLAEWKSWFDDHANVSAFRKIYNIGFDDRPMRPSYVLIFGRRSEFEGRGALIGKRANLARQNEILMTYDRLFPDPKSSEFWCVKLTRQGYEAITIPPTATLGPRTAEDQSMVVRKEKAVQQSLYIPRRRQEFLISRFSYWDQWARGGNLGIRSMGDYE